VYSYQNYYGYHFQDTLARQHGNHSYKFGGQVFLQGLNSNYGGNIQNYNFSNVTGGPTDTLLRQKYIDAFAQDDWKVNTRLTLNLGVTWIFTFAGHQADGHWTNFELTQQNPLWGNYKGAWNFAQNSGSTFQTDNTLLQFAPHVGGAYQLTNKLLVRGSYGLYYVPLGEFNAGYGYGFPSQQGEFWTGTNTVPNNIPGVTAFNWGNGYLGTTVFLPRTFTQTSFGYDNPFDISPKTLHPGRAQNFYAGVQYEVVKNIILDARHMGSRGSGHDNPESAGINYPDFNTYSHLLTSGHINDTVSNAGEAAAAGVPYPYQGFSGPAPMLLSSPSPRPLPTTTPLCSKPTSSLARVPTMPSSEIKARSAHNLNTDSHWHKRSRALHTSPARRASRPQANRSATRA
jgi:hypothetical protein